jgi:dipeptidyl-peptidase-4
MKKLLLTVLCSATVLVVCAQKRNFTVYDTEIGSRRDLAATSMRNLQWRSSNNYTFQDFFNVYQQSVSKKDSVLILNLPGLNSILRKANVDTLTYVPMITWANENEFYFLEANMWYNVNINEKRLVNAITLPENAENTSIYYPSKKIAFTLANNLYVIGNDNVPVQITNDANPDIVNGTYVSRNEFGIDEGIFWSPNGNYIAFYRKDNSKVGTYPLVDITAREAELHNIKYPMAGMASEHVSLGIFNVATKNTVFIDKNDTISEKYLTNISWSPDEQHVYIQVLNRAQNHMMMNKYLAKDGSLVKTLFEERNDRYVEPLNSIKFLQKNTNWFIYQSRRDGYNHAYIYNTEGELVKQLTSGSWEITRILDIDSQDNIYYMSTEISPIEEHGYKINAETSKKERLTSAPGMHDLVIKPGSKYYIDLYSSTTVSRIVNLMTENAQVSRNILTSANKLAAFNMPEMSIGTIKSADGKTDLYYRLIKPADFNSNKKYPAIIYVYGGPHDQLVNNQWLGGARLWDYMMAQKGYVMLTIDNRGSANRGLDFESIIHRQCGVAEVADQMEGVKLLKELGYVDMKRIGVHGWSYGGFMTISLMTGNPGVFKVGVAGGPVIDWQYYEVMYGERYMDTPQENPGGYSSTSLIPKAKNLKGKLLIIHGALDSTVVWQNSQQFIQECIRSQVPVDYFVYPLAEHNVFGPSRMHLMSKITSYFDDYLMKED